MADPAKASKRTKVIAALSLFFSLIGLLIIIIITLFADILYANGVDMVFLGGLSFPFGIMAWILAAEVKSVGLSILAAFVTFSFPVFVTIAHYTAGP